MFIFEEANFSDTFFRTPGVSGLLNSKICSPGGKSIENPSNLVTLNSFLPKTVPSIFLEL
jgi:hypothetical protein